MPWHVPTAAEFKMYGMYAVGMNNHEVLVPFLEGRAKSPWCMAEPHTKAQISQGRPFKEGVIPLLKV